MNIIRAIIPPIFASLILSCGHDPARAAKDAMHKGQQFYQKGSYGDAEIQFRKALQEEPRSGGAYLWLARAEKQLGYYPVAVANLNQAVALLPDQKAPKVELVNLLLLSYLIDPAHPAELRKQISRISEELLAGELDSFDGIRMKGYLALADANGKQAAGYFEQADRIKPNEPDVATALVESLLMDHQAPRAEEIARAFLRANPACGPVYTVLYQHYMSEHRFADAESLLKEKIANNPKEIQYRIEIARHYARTGKPQQMSETLNQLLASPKEFPGALLAVADFYAESLNWPEARRLYEQGLSSDPKAKVTYWKRMVRVALSANDRPEAQRLLEQILKQQPADAEARASHAALLMAGKDVQQQKLAGAEFKALVGEFPDNSAYHLQYADAMRLNGDVDGARAQYLSVLQKQPKNPTVLQTLADLSIRQQRFDDAQAYAERVLALDPRSVRARLVESAALASQRKFAETRTVLTGLVDENPQLREAEFQLALLDIEEKHFPDAEKRLLKYYKPGQGDVQALEGFVELYRAQNQMGKAIALLQQDLRKAPKSNDVRSLLADLAEQSGQYDLAVSQYEQLARDQPDSPAVAMRLGLAYQKKRDPARASAEFDRASKLAPQNPLVFAYFGKALDESGRKPEAIAADRRSLSLDNRNPWVMNNLAYLLSEFGGDLSEAQKLALEAVRLQPEDVSFSDTLGWVYLKKGDSSSALHVFESACEKKPEDVTFRIHLAMALLASGDRSKGRSELTAALRLPGSPEEKESIARLLGTIGSNSK